LINDEDLIVAITSFLNRSLFYHNLNSNWAHSFK
jgi:hypothetical protein